jgi:hypothetical protein
MRSWSRSKRRRWPTRMQWSENTTPCIFTELCSGPIKTTTTSQLGGRSVVKNSIGDQDTTDQCKDKFHSIWWVSTIGRIQAPLYCLRWHRRRRVAHQHPPQWTGRSCGLARQVRYLWTTSWRIGVRKADDHFWSQPKQQRQSQNVFAQVPKCWSRTAIMQFWPAIGPITVEVVKQAVDA